LQKTVKQITLFTALYSRIKLVSNHNLAIGADLWRKFALLLITKKLIMKTILVLFATVLLITCSVLSVLLQTQLLNQTKVLY
jgi:hypothetical protein